MGHESYHEPVEELSVETRDAHRALVSLQEELEAVDWYQQRMNACRDDELRALMKHNMEEEMEHAAMMLEWLRRKMPRWDEQLRAHLFTEKPILYVEEETP